MELIERAAEIGARHGVGIVDHIEDRVVGLKVRDIYEVPAAALLLRAHQELERLVGTSHQNQLKPVLDLMRPEYVFCDHRRLAAGRSLPAGPWTWVMYEVTDAGQALDLAGRGVAMVETMAPLRLAAELASREAESA